MTDSAFDAVLVLSFGGPEKPEDVMPFLENVVRGRNVPRERLETVAAHYQLFGGRSPINDQCRALIAALEAELSEHGPALPVYWGNRNWHPLLADTLRQMRFDGVKRALAFVTSAYGSYSGCRQYLQNIDRARAELGQGAPEVHKLRAFFDHPGFIESMAERVRDAHGRLDEGTRAAARLVFTAHSIPTTMADASPYVQQLEATADLVAEATGFSDYDLVWQSRSGPPRVPWLEPDILDHLRALAAAQTGAVLLAPIGFISDHMEVVYDLDHEARGLANELALPMERAATVGTHPRFVQMIRQLIEERVEGAPRRSLSVLGPAPDVCAADCCPPPSRPPSTRRGSP